MSRHCQLEPTTAMRRCFDPRDPAQKATDPRTWGWSRNPIMIAVSDILERLPDFRFDWAGIAEDIAACEARMSRIRPPSLGLVPIRAGRRRLKA